MNSRVTGQDNGLALGLQNSDRIWMMMAKGEGVSCLDGRERGKRLDVAGILLPKAGLTSDRLNAYFSVSVSPISVAPWLFRLRLP